MSTVHRSVSVTERFGKVITYQVTLDGVTFSAERMVGLHESYWISTHIGHCGHSFHQPTGPDGKRINVPGGSRVSARFLAIATELRRDPANFTDDHHQPGTRSASLCTDREACDRFRAAAEVTA